LMQIRFKLINYLVQSIFKHYFELRLGGKPQCYVTEVLET